MFGWKLISEEYYITLKKDIEIRSTEIKNLGRTLEVQIGRCQVLEESLQRAQQKEDSLLQKIFELTGVNKRVSQAVDATVPPQLNKAVDFIRMAKSGLSWNKVREKIENDARAKAWEQRAEEERVKKEIWDKEQAAKENKVFTGERQMGGALSTPENPFGWGEKDTNDKIS